MRSFLTAMSAVFALGACSPFETMSEIVAQVAKVEDALELKFGSRPEIGWKMRNGTMESVVVTFERAGVDDMRVDELAAATKAAVDDHLDARPKYLAVSITLSE